MKMTNIFHVKLAVRARRDLSVMLLKKHVIGRTFNYINMKLCSACLLGIPCRYDGGSKKNRKILALSKKEILIPICPEQLGGLPTPREAAEQIGRKVFTKSGMDVTKNFYSGANEVLKIAKQYKIKEAILKQKSPSCGSGQIYDGTFSGRLIKGDGVTAALLKHNKIKIISENDL